MSLVAIDYLTNASANIATLATHQPPQGPEDSWIDNVMDSMANNGIKKKLLHAAKVHPCIIEGNRVLVFQKGLKEIEPEAYSELVEFAGKNNFTLKEDLRDLNKKGIAYERRKARTTPMVLLAGGLFLQGAVQAGTISKNQVDDLYNKDYVFPQVQIIDEQHSANRANLVRDGKRSFTGTSGEIESILTIAGETKSKGYITSVSTHNVNMPREYVGGFINRYDYQFPKSDGGAQYSYYEGDSFGALGYYTNGRVIMDILVGGDKALHPKMGGPYDQILYDNHQMQLISYTGKHKEEESFLKATYSLGITAVISL